MKLHILGICGTFMAGIASLAQHLGHEVSGSDEHVYPPMSEQLRSQHMILMPGYEASHLIPPPDLVIVGNVIRRGNPAIEYILNQGLPYMSGPQWLSQEILQSKKVLAVAGTHGKTTTTSLLAWILECAGLNPSFLIGGVPQNFGVSARLTDSPYFVIEADEYDTAFFDKRSKFVHYRPRTLVINNLEFDHADIFPDLAAIQTQFHHLVRTVPSQGCIIVPAGIEAIQSVLNRGCWTPVKTLGLNEGDWQARDINPTGTYFKLYYQGQRVSEVNGSLVGLHNVFNALSAIAAADAIGVAPEVAARALNTFKNVKRRLEKRGCVKQITFYDDFAHHPTAIELTLKALRSTVGRDRIIACAELGSNTMRMGVHQDKLAQAFKEADEVHVLRPKAATWDVDASFVPLCQYHQLYDTVESMVNELTLRLQPNDHVIMMSNGSFGHIQEKLIKNLA